jgi:hypothetical protein
MVLVVVKIVGEGVAVVVWRCFLKEFYEKILMQSGKVNKHNAIFPLKQNCVCLDDISRPSHVKFVLDSTVTAERVPGCVEASHVLLCISDALLSPVAFLVEYALIHT